MSLGIWDSWEYVNAKLTLSWKTYLNKLCKVNIKLKSSCQWVMQYWHWVEKLMSMSYAKLTLNWKAHVNKLCKVNIDLKNLSMSYATLTLSWKAYVNEHCEWAKLINHKKRKFFC